ncbi:T9SS type A sorting domain-containing protein [bacterium]|nr:T9SS type A sorting domain-containing protein [bacterium]
MKTNKNNLSMTAAAVLALWMLYPAAAEPVLLARWTFNQNSNDVSGNGFNAELKGDASYLDDAAEGSHSLLLEGTGRAEIAAFDFGDTFTITLWCLLLPDVTNIQTLVANCEGGSRIDGFKLFVNNWETANKRILIEPSDGTDRIDVQTPENTFEDAKWNHVAMTADRVNGLMEIYYNGAPSAEANETTAGFQVTRPVFIGAMPPGNVYNWHGMIDDVRIYQGILTEEEIIASMDPLTGVEEETASSPASFLLGQNFPNPFNPATLIPYTLPTAGPVRLEVYDRTGRLVSVPAEGVQAAGSHTAVFSAENLPAGVYICRLRAAGRIETKKMILAK